LFISTKGSGVFSIDYFLEKRSEKQDLQQLWIKSSFHCCIVEILWD
jgi:hypothetical protein